MAGKSKKAKRSKGSKKSKKPNKSNESTTDVPCVAVAPPSVSNARPIPDESAQAPVPRFTHVDKDAAELEAAVKERLAEGAFVDEVQEAQLRYIDMMTTYAINPAAGIDVEALQRFKIQAGMLGPDGNPLKGQTQGNFKVNFDYGGPLADAAKAIAARHKMNEAKKREEEGAGNSEEDI